MSGFRKWLAAHKLSAKALLVYWPTLVAFWGFSKDFRDFVYAGYAVMPHWLHQIFAGLIVPALAFWKVRCDAKRQNDDEKDRDSGEGSDMRNMVRSLAIVGALLFASAVAAPRVHAQGVQNFYAAGVSYNGAGTPAIAGTALYAHQVSPDTAPGMYAFAMYDVLPTNAKPFTVTSNVGVGVAQKAFSIAGYDVIVPTAAGVSYSGSNVGWAWNTGAMVPIRYKQTDFYFAPTVRVSKSSIGGAGYQPIVGILFGFGK